IICLLQVSCHHKQKASLTELPQPLTRKMNQWTPFIGGLGGFFLYAEKGKLDIEIEKRDRNLVDRPSDLKAVFVSPDRKVIQERVIPDDGNEVGSGLGPSKSINFSTEVNRPGVYVVMIIVSNDRYGEDIRWRFRTNANKYMIETARGHKDQAHQEPIILLDQDRNA